MRALRAALACVVALAGCRSTPEPPPFEVEPPIEGADPAVRHHETVLVPAALRVERTPDGVAYGIDAARLEETTLDVGERMVVGHAILWYLTHGEGEEEFLGFELGSNGFGATSYLPVHVDDYADAGVEARIEVFETDIPPQHMWNPTGGRYRALWTRTLRARVPSP